MSQCPCRRCNDQNMGHSASCHMYLSLTECMTHISHPNCGLNKIVNIHTQRGTTDLVLHVLSLINISSALLYCLDAVDWHPFLRGAAQGHIHTHIGSLRHPTHTLNCSGPLFALTDVSAMLCWHLTDTPSHSDTLLFTNYSEQNPTCFNVSLCVSSMLPVCHHYILCSSYFHVAA